MLISISTPRPVNAVPLVVVAAATGVAVGVLTAFGQGWLSEDLGSLVNSAGPWALAASAVAFGARRPVPAAAAATIVLAGCEAGYALATVARGGDNASATVVFWLTAAAFAGPPLGVAAAWTRDPAFGLRRAIGLGVLPGVLIGEAVWGLTAIAATTNTVYWAAELALGTVGGAIAVWLAARSGVRPLIGVAAVLLTATAAAGILLAAAHLT